MLKCFERIVRETARPALVEHQTNFGQGDKDFPYSEMNCGSWIATNEKVYKENPDKMKADILACYHPILPLERLKNQETGEEQIKIAYKRNGKWSEIIVPKTMVTSATKIVNLSALGVSVTSETAKALVQYLADVENANDDFIPIQISTSKLGWTSDGFMPFDSRITFDGDGRFRDIYNSVHEYGDRDTWFDHVRMLRTSGKVEINLMLAASFASVLLKPLGALPFICDLWGETEGGKTVTLMIAASIWANPAESQYIGDFKTTDVALEARADMLNNLPMILDDTSKTSSRIRDNFEGVIYDLCSGKGKSRSNKDLGVNRENRWQNCILTNGERPLNSYAHQGGAINRILEVECGEHIYEDPQNTVDIIKKNYGFAGKEFVQAVKEMGFNAVETIQRDFQEKLYDEDKMQKQVIALSVVLTADKIATDCLFKDGKYISLKKAQEILMDENEVSDNERAYQFILDMVQMNEIKFDFETKCEKYGYIDGDYVAIYPAVFDEWCRKGEFSRRSFMSWADREGLIQASQERDTKVIKYNGHSQRFIYLRLEKGIDDLNFD